MHLINLENKEIDTGSCAFYKIEIEIFLLSLYSPTEWIKEGKEERFKDQWKYEGSHS